jgi:hypothetical protein
LPPGSNVKFARLSHGLKQDLEIVTSDEGTQRDRSDKQYSNAESPKLETVEPRSKVKFESPLQPQKQRFEIVATDGGIQID